MDFTEISNRYEKTSLLQANASEALFALLAIGGSEDVLDVGCGTGKLTARIRERTVGKVVGVDPSSGMIAEASGKYGKRGIEFKTAAAEDLEYENTFDAVFCNSTFQWFLPPDKPFQRIHASLKKGGRFGIQAPATRNFCPAFVRAYESVCRDAALEATARTLKSPWLFLESADEYRRLFEQAGFAVPFTRIESSVSRHTTEEIWTLFASGAAAGYLNPEYYGTRPGPDYARGFEAIARASFRKEAGSDGFVDLEFNRIYLVAVKP